MRQSKIRLLILNDSAQEAERLTSMLQNAGRSVRASHFDSEEALTKLLNEKVWDLLIAHDSTEGLHAVEAIKLIRRLNRDIPAILLTDREGSYPCVEGIKLGAKDVIRLDEDQHLLLAIDRELENRQERENGRAAERKFHEVASRNQQLLDSSRDAIAFIQDGMFLYANDSFAEMLEYSDKDDLECLPLFDVVHESKHDELKTFVKNFLLKVSEGETQELSLNVLSKAGQSQTLTFQVRHAVYDEEPCIQLLYQTRGANAEELEAQIKDIKIRDQATGVFTKQHLVDSLQGLLNNTQSGALFNLGIDDLSSVVQEKLGSSALGDTRAEIASTISSLVKKDDLLYSFTDESFALVIKSLSAQAALQRATELCYALRDTVFNVNNKTLHFNFHIGIALFNDTTVKVDTTLDESVQALETAYEQTKHDPNNAICLFERPDTNNESSVDIQHALDSGRFSLLFQPILSLRGADKEHYEVFMRITGDKGEERAPDVFFAEPEVSSADKIKIDRWVILEATKVLAEHRKKGHNTTLIIQLTADSMLDESLPAWLKVVFKTAELPTESVIFQLKEVDINDYLNDAIAFTKAIKDLGASVGVTHFGCALNPFKMLGQIESDYIKIDGSFTQDLQANGDNLNSVNNLISQLHQNDKITIVPYVESASLLSKLWQSGVHYIQGHYLQAPANEMDYDFDMES
jgi:EAL domain-containing protein (putative c-di-GMP-specific phosphodiesterase class I)/PleD family two-component response regulator